MTNIDDGIDDYSSTQWFKWESGHGKLSPVTNSGGMEEASIRMAKVYQQGSIHGAQIEQERIIELLENNLGNMNWEDLLKLIKEEAE